MSTERLMSEEDEARINLTLKTREVIIKELTKSGIPQDRTSCEMLMSALDGMDRTVLAKTKIQKDSEANKTNAENTKMVATMLAQMTNRVINDKRNVPLELPNKLTEIDTVPGETEIGLVNETYDTFINK